MAANNFEKKTKITTSTKTDLIGYITGNGSNIGVDTEATLLGKVYPVGSIYINATSSTNPATLLGFGTWVAFGAGRVLVGLDSGDTAFDTVEETGGAKTHTLTTAELASHSHNVSGTSNRRVMAFDSTNITSVRLTSQVAYPGAGTSYKYMGTNNFADGSNIVSADMISATQTAGSASAHNNLQPYIVVYMWKRTA